MEQAKTIQVSEDLLNSLLTSINSLRESVTKLSAENGGLREELGSVKTDLVKLQRDAGTRFSLFNQLPVEVRRMIWRLALSTPQVHIITNHRVSRSKINSVVNSCKEAREEAAAMKLDSFVLSPDYQDFLSKPHATWIEYTGTKNYANFEMDTIWRDWNEDFAMPKHIGWICAWFEEDRPLEPIWGWDMGPPKVGKLAINYELWHTLDGTRMPYAVDRLCYYGAQELLLVVEDVEVLKNGTDIVFRSPSICPWETKHGDSRNHLLDWDMQNGTGWSELEARQLKYLQDYKDQRKEDRKRAVETLGITYADLDQNQGNRLRDLSTWNVPKVRFVEARTADTSWIRLDRFEELV